MSTGSKRCLGTTTPKPGASENEGVGRKPGAFVEKGAGSKAIHLEAASGEKYTVRKRIN